MARRAWILVEWVEDRNVLPSYGIVSSDTLSYNESDLHPGKQILIRVKHDNPRRAQIVRISDSKRCVKQHKEVLERQDQQVKNVLQLCMRTIKEMKSESRYLHSMDSNEQPMVSQNNLPHVLTANSDDNSASDSNSEDSNQLDRSRMINKSAVKYMSQPQYLRIESKGHHHRSAATHSPVLHKRRRSITSSTPLPGSTAHETIKLCFDQGTQTDNAILKAPLAKIEEIETVLKNLYMHFQSVVKKVNNNQVSINMSESEHNDEDASYIEPANNESWMEPCNLDSIEAHNAGHLENPRKVDTGNIAEETRGEHNDQSNKIIVKTEADRSNSNASALHVRRMSAQTTINVEPVASDADMVPIGNGNAMVPARVLNEIDWKSHSTATRQLLQAVFPRRVLATHSLTGKQSPAFMNKPAKKILDPKLVDDIVKTVSSRCGVPKNLVRNCITIKCTDESKLYRNRQQYKRVNQASHQNEENVPPSPIPSSDESNAINL